MQNFPKAVRCQRCRANFYDVSGRCPECSAFTERGRKGMFWTVMIVVVSLALIALAIDLATKAEGRRVAVPDQMGE